MNEDRFTVRAHEPADRDGVPELAPRLSIGVAGWRDPARVARAVKDWLSTAAGRAPAADNAPFVAVTDGSGAEI
ncbi:hypothetical protein Aab01nite_01540 [Paractinoplanes abujensis]|uniref:GNAT family N-acetyltransferase n=1 Tax=Paractinoplanes abujensis TaxID=882441 RepID=A0A7W7G1C8_9ACTN|nr:hypothetical protein [Actinoplanes abujensis]MBB4692020.1 hypothetical protein [Actinoplanes abujensis]GID16564.1 hypothetical protein Aab01nite_01540 [Actinoplanes abujensis]